MWGSQPLASVEAYGVQWVKPVGATGWAGMPGPGRCYLFFEQESEAVLAHSGLEGLPQGLA